MIAGNQEQHVWIYSRYHLPWPAEDRDSIIESTINTDYGLGEVTIAFRSVTDARVPSINDVVRVPTADGHVFLKNIAKDRVFIRYEVKMDPGGWLPEWVSNQFTKNVPINTLTALKAQVDKTRGQYKDFLQRQERLWIQ